MSLVMAMKKLHGFFQGKEMSITTFYQKISHLVAVIEHFGGSIGDDPCLVAAEIISLTGLRYDPSMFVAPEIIKEAKKLARDKYLACLFLANTDKHRYEAVVNDLHNNFVKGHTSTYATTLDAAYTYLDNIRSLKTRDGQDQYAASFCQQKEKEEQAEREEEGASFLQRANGRRPIKCFGCDKENTYLNSCTNPPCTKI